MLCSVPMKSVVCPAVLTKLTLAPTAAFFASPPRSTTMASQTSDRGHHLSRGSGTTVTGDASGTDMCKRKTFCFFL